jgi:uncharacterized protein YndB with AHSA1/START domain
VKGNQNKEVGSMESIIEVALPPEEVFAYATDPQRFGEWQGDVVSVSTDGDAPLPVGARFSTTRRIRGTDRTMTQEVTESSPPYSWAARGTDGPIRPTARLTVEPGPGGAGSRITFDLDFEGHGIGIALLPLVRRQAEKSAPISFRKFKELLEARG